VPFHDNIVSDRVKNLGALFGALAWPLERSDGAWIMTPDEEPSKMGWHDALFEKAAPFVVDGSFIEATGEDGVEYEWRFMRGKLYRDGEGRPIVTEVKLTIPALQVRPALVQLGKKLPKLMKRLGEPSSLAAMFERLGWPSSRLPDGGVKVGKKTENQGMFGRSDERVLGALATFVAPDSYVEVAVGDDTLCYSFTKGELVVES
jgi:hypothetical protein